MTDARFLSKTPYPVKRIVSNLKSFCRIMVRMKSHETLRNRSRGLPTGAILYQNVDFFYIFGTGFPPVMDWGEVLHIQANRRARRPSQVLCDSMQRIAPKGRKKLIFDLWVNLITAACASRNPAGNKNYKKHNFIRDVARAGGGAYCFLQGGRIRLRHWAQGRT